MKNVTILILFTILSSFGYSFDYKSYVKNYLDSVNNTQVRGGICQDLIFDMIEPIKDKMLFNSQSWGFPVSAENAQTGDIMMYGNHILVVYSNINGILLVADQNRVITFNGVKRVEQFVDIGEIPTYVTEWESFVIYHPTELEDIELYGQLNKQELLDLFRVKFDNEEDMKKSNIEIKNPTKKSKKYFYDVNYNYNEMDLEYAKSYHNLCFGVGIKINNKLLYFRWVETDEGILEVTSNGLNDNNPLRWTSQEDFTQLKKGIVPNGWVFLGDTESVYDKYKRLSKQKK